MKAAQFVENLPSPEDVEEGGGNDDYTVIVEVTTDAEQSFAGTLQRTVTGVRYDHDKKQIIIEA